MSRPCRRSAATGVLRSEGFVGDVLEAEYAMPSRELTELLDLVAGGRAAMDGRTVSVAVVTLDYRLAPEHPHPAAVDDATALGERLASAGVEVEVEVWPEMIHVWHFFAGRVPEADQGIAAVAAWLRHRLGLRDGTLAP